MSHDEQHDRTPDEAPGPHRHRLTLRSQGGPATAVLELDGRPVTFVSRIELVLDAGTGQAEARLTVPAALLDLNMDAAAFVTAHTARDLSAAPDPA